MIALLIGPIAALQSPLPAPTADHGLTIRERWSNDDGLPQSTVTDLLEARDGFLWIATHGGVVRFDGAGFRTLRQLGAGVGPARVTCLLETPSGDLWLGTSTGVACLREGVLHEVPGESPPGQPGHGGPGWVHDLAVDGSGAVWAGGRTLFRVRADLSGLEAFELGELGAPTEVTGLHPEQDGTLLVATDRGLARIGGEAASPRLERLLDDAAVDFQRLVRDATGRVWAFGAGTQLALLEEPPRRFEGLDGARAGLELTDAALDGYGRLLLVGGQRLYRLETEERAGRVERAWLEPAAELGPHGPALALVVGRAGEVWVGRSWSGLQLLDREPFRVLGALDGEPGAVWKVVAADDGGLLVQLLSGALYRLEPPGAWSEARRWDWTAPLWSDVALAPDGTLWRLDGEQVEQVATGGEVLTRVPAPLSRPRSVVVASDGEPWVVADGRVARLGPTARGGLPTVGDAPVHAVVVAAPAAPTVPATPAGRRGDAEEDPGQDPDPDPEPGGDGTLDPAGPPAPEAAGGDSGARWFVSSAAAWLWDGESDEPVAVVRGPGGVELRALLPRPDGGAWISTYGAGLLCWNQGRLVAIDHRRGLPDDHLGGIAWVDPDESGGDGRLFVNSNRGVLVLEGGHLEVLAADEEAVVSCRLLGTSEGAGRSVARTAGGGLAFPTMLGLVLVDPRLEIAPAPPPAPRIEYLSVDGREVEPSRALRVPPGEGDLEVRFVAPDIAHPDGVRYRYLLEGRDGGWVDAGSVAASGVRRATYRGVPPGRYVFRVASSHAGGPWSEAPPVGIELRPHVHQTLWFAGLVAGLLILCGYLLRATRMRTLRAHSLALQAEIRGRRAADDERRRAEEQLRESTKLEAVGRLAGGIAHDFNNVLTAILGHAELLRGRAELLAPEDIAEHADSIEACSTKAASLTQQLLAFSRRQVLRPRVIDVNGIVLGLQKLLTHLLPDGIELRIVTSPATGCVRADPSQLEQVVMNLVLNARDACPGGGELLVETRRQSVVTDGEVRQYAVVSVTDSGRGIHPDDLPHVFEPFFTTKGAGGTGLGLASVHGIVVQSGGQVEVDSERGRGTTFRVLLPSVEGPQTGLDPEHAPVDEHRGSETVLVVDDYDPVRSVTRRTLELYGYTVLVADHPLRALELARRTSRPLSLLITDFAMPGMTGRELADRMLFEHPHLRVLFISGYITNVALQRQVVDDEVAFLQKPFAPEELARRVREVLGRPGARGLPGVRRV